MQFNYVKNILIVFLILTLSACGYRVLSIREQLKSYKIKTGTIKNQTSQFGIEQEFVKILHKRFLSNGINLVYENEDADFEIDISIKSVTFLPLSYRQGINVAYTYQYECKISAEYYFVEKASKSRKKVFNITESTFYFSADSPATTESNKRLAIVAVIDKITDRFLRELSLGI